MSNNGSPTSTRSPTSTMVRLTIPGNFDLTLNFTRGSIWPTATAFSTIEPRITGINSTPPVAGSRPCIQL